MSGLCVLLLALMFGCIVLLPSHMFEANQVAKIPHLVLMNSERITLQ